MEINNKNYVTGMFRGDGGDNMVTHLYLGDFSNPGLPMCSRGWQRVYFDESGELEDWEYSIFRNNISNPGLCKVCMRRAELCLDPIKKPNRKLSKQTSHV